MKGKKRKVDFRFLFSNERQPEVKQLRSILLGCAGDLEPELRGLVTGSSGCTYAGPPEERKSWSR